MKRALLMRRATFAAVAVWALTAASPAFAGFANFAINSPAQLAASDLQVIVNGTVQCPPGETAFINVNVSQIEHGDLLSVAFGSTGAFACNGTVQTWAATATTIVPMHDGPAHALANAFAFFPVFESALTTAEVHLQQ